MEMEGVTYCLLCAELKCFSKLIHLQANEVLQKTEIKLSRLNISYDDLDGEKLPRMICLSCTEKLDKAFEFVSGVDKALVILKEIYEKKLKKEDRSTEDQESDMLANMSDYSVHIKPEDANFSDSEASSVSLEKNHNIYCERSLSDQINKNCENSDATSKELSWNDFLWKCKYCETQFASFEELKIHSVQYHQCCNAFQCNDCNKRKLHLKRFIVHVKRHRKYLKPLCYKCNKCIIPSEVNDHIKTAHGPKTNYVCLGCDIDFVSSEELREHTQMLYKGKRTRNIPVDLQAMSIDSLTCVVCKKSFRTKELLNNHLLIHTDRKREHTCEKCGKCFLSKRDLAGHTVQVHDNTRPHQCNVCKRSFKILRHLKNHVLTHNTEKPHKCDKCGRGFRLKSQLNSHSIVHTDSRPHVCNYCEKKFRFRSVLYHHLRQHTGEKPYSCEICIRDFTNWPNYNVHMKRIHKIDMAKNKSTAKGPFNNPSSSKIIKHK